MRYPHLTALAAAFALALPGAASAQSSSPTARTTHAADTWRMPYQSGFWGTAGLSVGQSELDASCPAGFDCDDTDQAFRLHFGGRFNNAIGLEIGLLHTGRFRRGGGDTDGYGIDAALVAGFPIGSNSAIFGKLGTIYSRMDVNGNSAVIQTGSERDWGWRYGIGGQIGLTPQWAIRADWDRFEVALPGGREDLDTVMLGVQYTFR
jgi:opacity protein-like surface antigen